MYCWEERQHDCDKGGLRPLVLYFASRIARSGIGEHTGRIAQR